MKFSDILRGLIVGAAVTAFILAKKYGHVNVRSRTSSFRLTDVGFEIISNGDSDFDTGEKETVVLWEGVQAIVALKRDVGNVDQIALIITSKWYHYWIDEDDPNWGAFVDAMEANLPVNKEWFGLVSQPPYAQSRTILFTREDDQEADSSI